MAPSILTGFAILGSLVLIAARVPIAYALLIGSVGGLSAIYGWSPEHGFVWSAAARPLFSILGDVPFRFVHSYEISTIPLYILLGTIAQAAGITTDVFNSMRVLVGRVRGGLAVASVLGCGGFAALSGSSLACAAAMGRIAVPEMLERGYDARLASGSVAVGGTLGALIPPSIPFLLFAVLAEQSVGKLLLAGIMPGILSLIAYLITIMVWVRLRPDIAPLLIAERTRADVGKAFFLLWPATLLLAIIIGGIFSGWFTTIQAASISVLAAAGIGFARRLLTPRILLNALRDAALQSALLFVMAFGAKLMITMVAASHFSNDLLVWTESLGLGRWEMIMAIVLILLVMGMFLDPAGILLLMVPITLPLVESMNFNTIWYAVIFVKLLEIGLITPPIGLNAFMVKAAVPDKYGVQLSQVFAGIGPFLILEAVVLFILLAFPSVSLLIPNMM